MGVGNMIVRGVRLDEDYRSPGLGPLCFAANGLVAAIYKRLTGIFW